MTVSIGSQNLSSSNAMRRVQAPKSSRIRDDKALMWLYENLLTHQLATKLHCLLSDNEHLTHCYEVTLAYFGSTKFVDAFYICLSAFDKHQYDILLQIDQTLYLSVITESLAATGTTDSINTARRNDTNNSTSIRNRQMLASRSNGDFCDIKSSISSFKKCYEPTLSPTNRSLLDSKSQTTTHRKYRNGRSRCKIRHSISLRLRRFVSLPDLRQTSRTDVKMKNLTRSRSQLIRSKTHRMKLTVENLALNDRRKVPALQSSQTISASNHLDQQNAMARDLQPINLVKCDDIKIHTDRRGDESSTSFDHMPSKNIGLVRAGNLLPYLNTSHNSASTASTSPGKKQTSNSAPGDFASFFAANGAKIENRYQQRTIFDQIESGTSLSPLCNHDHCALIPNRGQSLTSYLQEAQRTRRNITDLERENAHFSLSDAIISAIEEIKCSRMERKKEKQVKANAQQKKRKSHQRPLRNWNIRDDENGDRTNANIEDDESFMSESMTTISRSSSSSSDSDLTHISSSSDSSTTSNAGDLKRLKVQKSCLDRPSVHGIELLIHCFYFADFLRIITQY